MAIMNFRNKNNAKKIMIVEDELLVAHEIESALLKDKYEICPGQASQMRFMSRYAPGFLLKQMSKTVDRMHAN